MNSAHQVAAGKKEKLVVGVASGVIGLGCGRPATFSPEKAVGFP